MNNKQFRNYFLFVSPYGVVLFLFLYVHSFLTNSVILSSWNFTTFSFEKYFPICLIYLIVMSVIYWAQSILFKKIVLVLFSMVVSMILYGMYSLLFFFVAYIFYCVMYLPVKTYVKILMLFFMFEISAYFILDVFYYNSVWFWYSFLFAYYFFFRFFFFMHYNIMSNFKRESFIDLILFIFFPAYFIILPHIFILPQYRHFTESLILERDEFVKISQRGVKNIYLGLLYLMFEKVVRVIPDIYFLKYFKIDYDSSSFLYNVMSTRIILDYLGWMLLICGYGYVLFGLVRGLGYNIKSPFNKPLYAKNIVDLYERLLNHFKDYYMIFFYMPIVVVFRHVSKYWRSFIAVVMAFLVGGMVLNFLLLGFEICSAYSNGISDVTTVVPGFANGFVAGSGEAFDTDIMGVRHLLPQKVSWVGLHKRILVQSIQSLIFGFLFGGQLVFNQWVNANKKSTQVKLFLINPISKFIQFFLMLLFVFIFL